MKKRRPKNGAPRPPPNLPSDAHERLEFIRKAIIANKDGFEAMEYAANAIGSFLAGESLNLDHAFGIVKGVGRPPKAGKHLSDAVRAWKLRQNGKTDVEIAEELNKSDRENLLSDNDVGKLLKRYKRHIGPAIASEVNDELNKHPYRSPLARLQRRRANRMKSALKSGGTNSGE